MLPFLFYFISSGFLTFKKHSYFFFLQCVKTLCPILIHSAKGPGYEVVSQALQSTAITLLKAYQSAQKVIKKDPGPKKT